MVKRGAPATGEEAATEAQWRRIGELARGMSDEDLGLDPGTELTRAEAARVIERLRGRQETAVARRWAELERR
jgi:hypothetical protein